MALTIAVGQATKEVGRASVFSDLLNWVAAQPGAADGKYAQVLDVEPCEWLYSPSLLPALVAELEALLERHPKPDHKQVLSDWLDMARQAQRSGTALEFV